MFPSEQVFIARLVFFIAGSRNRKHFLGVLHTFLSIVNIQITCLKCFIFVFYFYTSFVKSATQTKMNYIIWTLRINYWLSNKKKIFWTYTNVIYALKLWLHFWTSVLCNRLNTFFWIRYVLLILFLELSLIDIINTGFFKLNQSKKYRIRFTV